MTQGDQETTGPAAADPAAGPEPEPPPAGEPSDEFVMPPAPVRVAWAAGPETFDRYARVLQPLAVGLMDELVDLAGLCPPSPDNHPLLPMPCETVPCPIRGWLGYPDWAVERLVDFLRRWKVDLIHAVDASAAELARATAQGLGVPYIVSSYDLADARDLGHAADQADVLLAASQPIADALAARTRQRDRIRLLRPGVYHVKHATCFQEPGNSVALVAGGPLDNFKSFDAVLRCFAELVGRKFDCMLFIIGSGRMQRKLRQQALRLGLGPKITFIDALPTRQLARIFQDADIYITPAAQNAIDMHSLLAMAAGVPVLAGSGRGANDFLRDGQTVREFACGDAGELTAKLAAMLDDRASARALAESALEYLRVNHSPAHNVAALARMYREVLGARTQASGSRPQASGTARASQ